VVLTGLARRSLVGALVAAPLVTAAALARRARSSVVGAQPFADSRVEGVAFPRRLVDAAGETRLIPAPPHRIVSTYLGCEEVLALLVPIARVVGVSVYADDASTSNCLGVYPPQVARLRAEPERVLSLQPDLVCVSGYTDIEALRLLAGAGLTLLRWSRLDSFADVVGGVRLLGAAVGADGLAGALAAQVEGKLADVEGRLRGVRPLRALYYDTPGYTMGAGTLVDEILRRAGARNVAAEIGMRGPGQIGVEMVMALQPEVILMPHYGPTRMDDREGAVTDPLLRGLPALPGTRVHEVQASLLTTVSPHAARGLIAVARLFHPERF
jgi:iron complex transport system substrate-binding protein